MLENDADVGGIRVSGDFEIVFDAPIVPVIDQIHAGIHRVVAHASELFDAGAPVRAIRADELV